MLERSQIGKYRGKETVFIAKTGRIFQLPSGREYKFAGYEKIGRKHIITIEYMGKRVRLSEVDYNTNMENVLTAVENETRKN